MVLSDLLLSLFMRKIDNPIIWSLSVLAKPDYLADMADSGVWMRAKKSGLRASGIHGSADFRPKYYRNTFTPEWSADSPRHGPGSRS